MGNSISDSRKEYEHQKKEYENRQNELEREHMQLIQDFENERINMEYEKRRNHLDAENKKKQMEFDYELRKKQMELDTETTRKKFEFEDEARKRETVNEERRMELAYETHKRDIELSTEEMKKSFEFQKKKTEMEHQHKIAELIVQMKQTKLQAGKELLLAYMKTIHAIIEQNANIFQAVDPLLNQLKDEILPKSVMSTIEKAGFMGTKELLDYSKEQINKLMLKQDDDFIRLLDSAVDQKVITEENKMYLLESVCITIDVI
ncbi:14291_t:CDS:2 [Dentiscutata erythropus]|uniref:14291_t:CDS:1 n=1 Tax=Dentiscutata erythropus TaxID=1348616 RepID=A0A9N9EIH7_9GLOM|nr:14291_t:CDS:2 [Dentiscutata erythropus]